MRGSLAGLALLMLCACAPLPPAPVVSERVILLPGPDERSSGELHVQDAAAGGRPQQLLLGAYAQIERAGSELRRGSSTAQSVQRRYGAVLAMQPMRPRRFVIYFCPCDADLTPEAAQVLKRVLAALAEQPAGELILTGHTDTVGSLEANERLSLARAQAVRDLLVANGAASERISVVGRGERELLVPTADEVPEARNHRVEIKLR